MVAYSESELRAAAQGKVAKNETLESLPTTAPKQLTHTLGEGGGWYLLTKNRGQKYSKVQVLISTRTYLSSTEL